MPESGAALTLIAFDFGLRRIGVAVGDSITGTAAPCPAIRGDLSGEAGLGPDWKAIARQVRTTAPQRLIVGAPYNEAGDATPMTQAARRFAVELARRFALPVCFVDERYSSLEAAAALKEQRASGRRRRRVVREDIDSASAALILERWLGGGQRGEEVTITMTKDAQAE